MKTRIITGSIAAVLLIALIYWAPIEAAICAIAVCSVLSYLEFDKLFFEKASLYRQSALSAMILLILMSLRQSLDFTFVLFGSFYVLLAIVNVVGSAANQTMKEVVQHFSVEVVGCIYISGLFGFLIPILEIPGNGKDYLFLLFLLVFMGDTAAYFVGKKWGKRLLAAKVSPKKTVEGSIAAIVVSLIVSMVWVKWFYGGVIESRFVLRLLAITPIISILAQLGDLFESVLKRSQGQKDSGSFLPGHGGILDRVDGLAFSAPIFYFYVTRVLEKI